MRIPSPASPGRCARIVALAAATALAALTALLPAAAGAAQLGARTQERLDRTLATVTRQTWNPGTIAGVWVGDRGWTAATGVADRVSGRVPRLGDHTRIGSVTKTFTATLILRLADQGRLTLDDTIDRWFPAFPGASGITIRQLGTMSSGIASYSTDAATVDRFLTHPTAAWTPQQLIAISAGLPVRFAPGAGFDYSNTNFVMLGQIVEQVTGRALATVMQEQLFGPLGMRHTTYKPLLKLPSPAWSGFTIQGAESGAVLDATGWNPTFADAAGQIVSTLGDLRIWTRAVGSGALLKPATQAERLKPNPHSERAGRAYLFGLGRAAGWLLHSGELPGYNTQIAYLPKRRLSIVVLTNADIGGANGNPAPAIFNALAATIAPGTLPSN
ncbi:serine hydrolase domain-containing protein [Conexibacter sp. JD483]|uniref:serine hydrolase domain-containing protein n=1 Tax=unclassified Conexibacter TaxID=2627773 RepID=UPI00271823E1|nr:MULTISPECIES: serine hydrolase domain-containing protein [unclassified Conexibacter]MDO8186058.1 serine hydrolase domain-containing protein [Conexibacter sp. CPCC 205706]MDO8199548.1 serine hydrolase domain-containing protein [Conexibacter sp. CPCC 205762]MDR9372016.1 serine hydrolase domain-containing protein [Conexibacter sp. JD483]